MDAAPPTTTTGLKEDWLAADWLKIERERSRGGHNQHARVQRWKAQAVNEGRMDLAYTLLYACPLLYWESQTVGLPRRLWQALHAGRCLDADAEWVTHLQAVMGEWQRIRADTYNLVADLVSEGTFQQDLGDILEWNNLVPVARRELQSWWRTAAVKTDNHADSLV